MYDLVPLFESYNIQVQIIKKEKAGYVIFEDEFQIVTIPYGKEKSKVL